MPTPPSTPRACRAHTRLLHSWGIGRGLGLTFIAGATHAIVGEGEAIDGLGREVVLDGDARTEDVARFAGKVVFVTIAYGEALTDVRAAGNGSEAGRYTETPVIEVREAPPAPPGEKLILGRLTVGADGKITATDNGVEPHRRREAGKAATVQQGFTGGTIHFLSTPIRVLDTRPGARAAVTPGAKIQGGTELSVQVTGSAMGGISVPAGAVGVIGNATVVNNPQGGHLILFPADVQRPLVASSNYGANQTVNTPTTVRLSPDGKIKIFASATTDVVFDAVAFVM